MNSAIKTRKAQTHCHHKFSKLKLETFPAKSAILGRSTYIFKRRRSCNQHLLRIALIGRPLVYGAILLFATMVGCKTNNSADINTSLRKETRTQFKNCEIKTFLSESHNISSVSSSHIFVFCCNDSVVKVTYEQNNIINSYKEIWQQDLRRCPKRNESS